MNYRIFVVLYLALCLQMVIPDHIIMDAGVAATRESGYTKVNVTVASEMIRSDDGLFILDVQDHGDHLMHHIRNAYSIPLSDLGNRTNEINPKGKILVYGDGGYGGTVGGETLVDNGFENVYAMCCGIRGWMLVGYDVFTRYPSIQSAIDGTPEGGSVFLSYGTYREEVTLNRSVSLVGENRNTTVIETEDKGICINVTSRNNSISDITLSGGSFGIVQYRTENNIIINCTFTDLVAGVSLDSCTGIGLESNDFSECGVLVKGERVEHWNSHTMDCTNIINGKQLLYMKDRKGTAITEEPGQIILSNCSNISINGKCLESASTGISLGFSSHNSISGNAVRSNGLAGILLYSSDNNTIFNNTVDAGGGAGITLASSRDNSISMNLVRDNLLYGAKITNGESNIVVNNTFFRNNMGKVQGADDTGENRWDDGTFGNYWSDYEARFPDASNDTVRWSMPYPIDGSPNMSDDKPLVWPTFGTVNHPIADAGPDAFIFQHQEIILNGTMSFDRDEIVNFTWSFAYDGSTVHLFGPNPVFTFHEAGSYDVSLTVTNPRGNMSTDTVTIHVVDIEGPVANAGENITLDQYRTAYFDGSRSTDNVNIVVYRWSFIHNGSSITLYGVSPQFAFEVSGEYQIILNVSDKEGNRDIDTLRVIVKDITPPRADAGMDVDVIQGSFFLLDARGSTDNVGIVNYTWLLSSPLENFTFHGMNFTYFFREPGVHTAILIVRDAMNNTGTDTINITVDDVVPPVAVAGDNITSSRHGTIIFDGAKSSDNHGIVNYSWSFSYGGRNITLYGVSPSFTFNEPGKYVVELKVKDSSGNQDVDHIMVEVVEDEGQGNRRGSLILNGIIIFILILMTVLLYAAVKWKERRKDHKVTTEAAQKRDSKENMGGEDDEGSSENGSIKR